MADYLHGHAEAVLAGHRRRTAEDCCAYLLPWLRGDEWLLDVGCGPGTITVGLARHLPDGRVTAIDPAPEAVAETRRHVAEAGLGSVDRAAGRRRTRCSWPVRSTWRMPIRCCST